MDNVILNSAARTLNDLLGNLNSLIESGMVLSVSVHGNTPTIEISDYLFDYITKDRYVRYKPSYGTRYYALFDMETGILERDSLVEKSDVEVEDEAAE